MCESIAKMVYLHTPHLRPTLSPGSAVKDPSNAEFVLHWMGLMLERKENLPTRSVPVAGYVGSSKNLKDLKGRVVGPRWEKLKPKGPKGCVLIFGFHVEVLMLILSAEGQGVRLCRALSKP